MLYDTLIIGAGPAGLTASIYASRYKLSNLVIGKMVGGTITYAHKVENFPGFTSISGFELGQKMAQHAKSFGVEILGENVGKIERLERDKGNGGNQGEMGFGVFTETGKEFRAKSLIVTTGTERRKLDVPGEKEYTGRGVSYCTSCDIPFYKDKIVVLVGGSNAACSGAVHAADFASKVYIVYRKDKLRAEPVWVEEVKNNPKIEIIYETNITKILGYKDIKILSAKGTEILSGSKNAPNILISQYLGITEDKVGGVEIDKEYKGSNILPVDGVFVEIGGMPASSFLVPVGVELDENGYVIVDDQMKTNVLGIFAAGDFTTKSLFLQQTVTACADGAKAAVSTFKYLKSR